MGRSQGPLVVSAISLVIAGSGAFSSNDLGGDQLSIQQAGEQLVDVGGRRLLISCVGDRSPTVIVERGLAGNVAATPPKAGTRYFSGAWGGVQAHLAPFTRVCLYSRANVGPSDPDPAPVRTGIDVVADLHALVQTANVPRPYVLVGHSLGGVYARLYANRYQVNAGRVSNVINALAGIVQLDDTKDQPQWLGGGESREFLAVENGLLDLSRLLATGDSTLVASSPLWFSPVRLPVAFDPTAEAPQWNQFLERVLEGDKQRIAVLQEWFG
jgi:pimeloyl-ACP methyl ester carboxylesterase